jgi:hypothetical protein
MLPLKSHLKRRHSFYRTVIEDFNKISASLLCGQAVRQSDQKSEPDGGWSAFAKIFIIP